MPDADGVGVVLGHQAASSQEFQVGILDGRSLEVDDLVAVTTPDPMGEVVTYGVVTESHAIHEGASMPSDSMVIAEGQMPGELVRTAQVQVVRVDPERWVAPHPGQPVRRARAHERELALYEDTMARRLAVGMGRDGEPVSIDLDFLDGTKGGHVSISGISGVATKTSTALALIRLLLAHPDMRRRVRVLLFNVKGEDLLFLDKPNATYAARDDRPQLDERWRRLGLDAPGGFPDVAFWAPPRGDDHRLPSSESRHEGVKVFGWTPHRFAVEGLLRFCFTDASDMRGQLSMLEEQIRIELLRRAVPVEGHAGALGLMGGPVEGAPDRRGPRAVSELQAGPFHDLDGLVEWLVAELDAEDGSGPWTRRAAPGTVNAFIRRLQAAAARLRGLIRSDAAPVPRGDAAQNEPPVAVVHLARLHEFAQRFVVGTLLAQTFAAKEAGKREPIEFVVLDELNKYAPREGDSPIKETLVDIAQRGRSLGVILVGAQQQASLVAPEVTQNAAIRIAGRLDAAEAERSEYGWLGTAARARARLLMQGRVLVSQPSVPAPIAVEVPFPPWATTHGEVSRTAAGEAAIARFG
ncbi:MAG: ATP-binding protein [Thermoleophilia bacterium]